MPLHLLGKKSWNVYNVENIARVRRDEAEAHAREEAEEKRKRDADVNYRLEQLRGRPDQSLSSSALHISSNETILSHRGGRKRRKLAGEDDTDRDIRLAEEDASALAQGLSVLPKSSTAPIVDDRGHINLFPREPTVPPKNEDVELEKTKKRQEYEDQYTLRLSNAAGTQRGSGAPWYSRSKKESVLADVFPGKDVWGNEDPGRQAREQTRLSSADPLTAMKKGVRQLRESEVRRKEWMKQRERDLNEVEKLARRKHGGKKRSSSEGSLEDFNLDTGYITNRTGHSRPSRHRENGNENPDRHHRHHHRHRRSERDRERDCRRDNR